MNEALGRLRKRKPEVSDVPEGRTHLTPEKVMGNRETRDLIERAIDRLPDEFRLAFVARMVEGLSVQETADLLAVKPETVKTRVHRARTRLRAELESHVAPSVREAYAFDGERCARLTASVLARI